MLRMAAGALAMVMAGAWGSAVCAQPPAPGTPQLVIKSMSGRDLYQFYCASCHGCDAKGKGPVAPALTTSPTDLTQIAAAYGGVFPRDRIVSLVSGGRTLPAHGSSDMPVWGPIFRGLDLRPRFDEVRIANIVRYIESIQAKSPGRDCK